MGILSSIKKGLSKAWKGIKRHVKKVAKTVKKVAKKVAYALPFGKKLWKLGGKIGSKIMQGLGKITSKLGPIGTMALSFVLAPVMGPAISSLWAGFGSGAAAMAASANAFVSTLGSVGSSIFAAGNFVGGTLGALGNAITEGASNVMAGNFSQAATSFASNIGSALTGEAGMAAVHAGSAVANATAAAEVASAGGSAAQVNQLSNTAGEAINSLQGMGQVGTDAIAGMDPNALSTASNEAYAVQQNVQQQIQASQMSSPSMHGQTQDAFMDSLTGTPQAGPVSQSTVHSYGEALDMTTKAMSQTGVTDAGIMQNTINNITSGNTGFVSGSGSSNTMDNLKKAKDTYDQFTGGGMQGDGYQPYVPQAIKSSQAGGNAQNVSGTGSEGFSLLGGVRGLEQSVRNSQQMMFG